MRRMIMTFGIRRFELNGGRFGESSACGRSWRRKRIGCDGRLLTWTNWCAYRNERHLVTSIQAGGYNTDIIQSLVEASQLAEKLDYLILKVVWSTFKDSWKAPCLEIVANGSDGDPREMKFMLKHTGIKMKFSDFPKNFRRVSLLQEMHWISVQHSKSWISTFKMSLI